MDRTRRRYLDGFATGHQVFSTTSSPFTGSSSRWIEREGDSTLIPWRAATKRPSAPRLDAEDERLR